MIHQIATWLRQHPSRVYGYLTTALVQLSVIVPGLSANNDFRILCAVLGIAATEAIHAKVTPAPKNAPGGDADKRQPVSVDIPVVVGK